MEDLHNQYRAQIEALQNRIASLEAQLEAKNTKVIEFQVDPNAEVFNRPLSEIGK